MTAITRVRAIALCGGAGVGKTTFARLIQKEFLTDGQLAIVVSFATMLKIEVMREFGLGDAILEPAFDKTTPLFFSPEPAQKCRDLYGSVPKTLRELFQFHGTYRRRQTPGYWLMELNRTISGMLIGNRDQFNEVCFIFDDVRYQNEIDYVRSGFPVSSRVLKLERAVENLASGHESENQKLDIDLILDLDKDTVGVLPVAARCDHFKGKTIEELVRAPGS